MLRAGDSRREDKPPGLRVSPRGLDATHAGAHGGDLNPDCTQTAAQPPQASCLCHFSSSVQRVCQPLQVLSTDLSQLTCPCPYPSSPLPPGSIRISEEQRETPENHMMFILDPPPPGQTSYKIKHSDSWCPSSTLDSKLCLPFDLCTSVSRCTPQRSHPTHLRGHRRLLSMAWDGESMQILPAHASHCSQSRQSLL